MKRKKFNADLVFGMCRTEMQVRAGQVQSSVSADDWHARCAVTVMRPSGEKQCACPHHETED